MPLELDPNKVNRIQCEIYTISTRTTGSLNTIHPRFSDALNSADQDFLLLKNTQTASFATSEDGLSAASASALVRKNSVVLAIPREGHTSREIPPHRQQVYVHKRPVESIIEASPFIIRGTLHMPATVELLQHAHDPFRLYIPVTDAKVNHNSLASISFQTPFLLLNRQFVEVMVETGQLGRQDTETSDEPPIVPLEVDAMRAALLLGVTPIFDKIPSDAMEVACAQMAVNGGLSRIQARAGAELFKQGDVGKAIYVVERGKLNVERTIAGTRQAEKVGELADGELAGEMALVGDGRRTTTVRAAEDSVLLAMDISATKHLMNEYPSAASSLLRLMLDREGGLDISRRSLPPLAERAARNGGGPNGGGPTPFRLAAM